MGESEPSTFSAFDRNFRERMISNGREYAKNRQDRMKDEKVYIAGNKAVAGSKFKVKGAK